MIEKPKKQKKCLISEEDISTLLQRYTANTVLALLQEVAQNPGVKHDWKALVKNSSTGISNAREYQMLWRHLAYRYTLLDKLEDGAQPLDDDSDLEYELEAFPDVSSEAATEAAACVKVLIASGVASDSSHPNNSTVEAPLTINIPNGQSFRAPFENSQSCLMQGVNITVPVSVQKQPLPAVPSTEIFNANGSASGSLPPRRKRKPWSEEEDQELIGAVQKCGEGNWANILRGDFKGGRTASQLSQRWAILRKRNGNLTIGGPGSRLSEVQQAARHAVSLALNFPIKDRMETCTNSPVGTTLNSTSSNSLISTTTAEASLVGNNSVQGQNQTQKGPVLKKSLSMGQLGSTSKSRVISKKSSAKPNFDSDSMVRATAVAAGARIATPTDAALLLKAAQSKNAVHIKSSLACGLVAAPLSTYPAGSSRPGSVKAASLTVQHNPSTSAMSSQQPKAMSSQQTNAVTSSRIIELPPKQEVTTAGKNKVSGSGNETKEQVQEDGACVPRNNPNEEVQEDEAPSPNPEAEIKNQGTVAENPNSFMNMEKVKSDQVEVIGNQAEESQSADDIKMMSFSVKESETQAAVEDNCINQSANEEHADLTSMVIDGCCENMEVSSKAQAANEM